MSNSSLAKRDGLLQEFIDSPNPKSVGLDGRNCGNCRNSLFERGDSSVGMPDSYICGIAEDADFEGQSYDWYEQLQENLGNKFDERVVAQVCPHYKHELVEKCCNINCQNPLNVPEYLHKLWADFHYGDPVPVCSQECKAVLDHQAREELRLEEEYEGQLEAYHNRTTEDEFYQTDEGYEFGDYQTAQDVYYADIEERESQALEYGY